MTRLRLSAALVVLVLLGGCSPAATPETAAIVKMELESLRQRAEEGDADAQYELGFVYARGLGVPQDYAQAATWYRLAVDQGHAPAQLNLGVLYRDGEGVPQDYTEAHKWYNLAAARATDDREPYVKVRDLLAKSMTPAQLAEAQRLAREWQAAFDARQE